MKELLKEVAEVVNKEYKRAKENFGETYASKHEAYGVLAEEMMEATYEVEYVKEALDRLLDYIHEDDERYGNVLGYVANHALFAAAEFIQVAAVCEKALGHSYEDLYWCENANRICPAYFYCPNLHKVNPHLMCEDIISLYNRDHEGEKDG